MQLSKFENLPTMFMITSRKLSITPPTLLTMGTSPLAITQATRKLTTTMTQVHLSLLIQDQKMDK
jgi:hypothetical protein